MSAPASTSPGPAPAAAPSAPPIKAAPKTRLQRKLEEPDGFAVSFELVPGRGPRGKNVEWILDFAKKVQKLPELIDCMSLTDNVGGNSRISPDVLGHELHEMGMESMIHFSCKDKNRNFMVSRAFQLERLGIRNLLTLTGDAPIEGFKGQAKPTFDLDSVGLCDLLRALNEGLPDKRSPGGKTPATNFYIGAVVSPFKQLESELMTQYYKLHRKVRFGAQFIVSQLGYDARKQDELVRFMRRDPVLKNTPLMGNVYVLSKPVAQAMHKNMVPGCVITKELLGRCEEWAREKDKGKRRFLEFAAQQLAILRGLDYRGAHIGGFNISFEDVKYIIEVSRELEEDWRTFARELQFKQENEFYFFERDPESGLNTDTPVDRKLTGANGLHLGFRLMDLVHEALFDPKGVLYAGAQKLARGIDGVPSLKHLVTLGEKYSKELTNDCRECGDCALPDLAQLCPESQCGKFIRNGPCGGTYQGMCEVHPEKQCIYVRAYDRLKAVGKEEWLNEMPLVTRDWELDRTSSWLNFYMGREHHHMPTPWPKAEGDAGKAESGGAH